MKLLTQLDRKILHLSGKRQEILETSRCGNHVFTILINLTIAVAIISTSIPTLHPPSPPPLFHWSYHHCHHHVHQFRPSPPCDPHYCFYITIVFFLVSTTILITNHCQTILIILTIITSSSAPLSPIPRTPDSRFHKPLFPGFQILQPNFRGISEDSLGVWIPGPGFRIPSQWNLDSGSPSLVGFRIP